MNKDLIVITALLSIAVTSLLFIAIIFTYYDIGILSSYISSLAEKSLPVIIIATFTAAFAGAYGAQHIAENNRRKSELLKEIRNINAAIMVVHSICNNCFSLKKQHVKVFQDGYSQQQEELSQHLDENQHIGVNGKLFSFQADFQTFPTLISPINMLEKLLFEKISSSGKSLSFATALITNIQSLNGAIEQRNKFVNNIRNMNLTSDELAVIYFGLPDSQGHRDTSYPDYVEAIYETLDSCIFFSSHLCEILHEYGLKAKVILGDSGQKINKVNFSKAEELDLMPDKEKYEDWLSMFSPA